MLAARRAARLHPGRPRCRRPCRAPRAAPAHAGADVVLAVGFAPDELAQLQANAAQLLGSSDAWFVAPQPEALAATVAALLAAPPPADHDGSRAPAEGAQGAAAPAAAAAAAAPLGRMLYFLLGECKQRASAMNYYLAELGMAPAIVAAPTDAHAGLPLHEALARVRAAHAAHHRLHLSARVRALAAGELDGARVAANIVLDRAEGVPTSTGGLRADEAHVVVLDGLCSEQERAELLAWLTAEGHDHGGPPPDDKWERVCVDRAGDAATWGLRHEVLEQLQEQPPAPLVSIHARLAALYPELELCHMPAASMLDPEEAEAQPLSSFVANAVMPGDPCAWHLDADPSALPPTAPWVEHHGYYYNRELGKPLLVSVLLYLNRQWPEEGHAETLFLDPATGTGALTQPRPGRLVLMDQDVAHRINAPSQQAPGPRYSLVWKMAWLPRGGAGQAAPRVPGGRGGQAAGAGSPGLMDEQPFVSLARPEWGAPQRLGSASALGSAGVAAMQPPSVAAL